MCMTLHHQESSDFFGIKKRFSFLLKNLMKENRTIVVAVTPKKILLIDAERGVRDSIQENDEISSLYLSQDGRFFNLFFFCHPIIFIFCFFRWVSQKQEIDIY